MVTHLPLEAGDTICHCSNMADHLLTASDAMQACRKQANPSSASQLLQSAGWWRPHEQLGLVKANRAELFPLLVQVLPFAADL